MVEVIGVSFAASNKIYYFLPNDIVLKKGDKVIVETERGLQYGVVKTNLISVESNKLYAPLKKIIKKAKKEDEKIYNEILKLQEKALLDAISIAEELKLDMRILTATFTFDKKQLLFNFVSNDRIDFRDLAKKLASIYKTRIELRQIGVRDKAKEVGGYGQCGRTLCCSNFLKDLNSVSINMAKNQNLALNPQKINGVCGRLMCCLEYENSSYNEYKKNLPKINEKVKVENGVGKVIYVDIFNKKYKVETEDGKIIEMSGE